MNDLILVEELLLLYFGETDSKNTIYRYADRAYRDMNRTIRFASDADRRGLRKSGNNLISGHIGYGKRIIASAQATGNGMRIYVFY